jgi:peptidoglycan/xylan/chitin deacetylase (PgdA/CDA1 family)
VWNLLQTVFAAVPALDEIELTGVRFGDTPVAVNLMKVAFSAAASRDEFRRAAVATPLGDSVNALPRVWSAPDSDQQAERGGAPPTAPSRAGGEIYHGDESRQAAAMTFDDGPFPIYTTLLLDTLGRLGVKATFFLVGQQVRAYPYLARAIASAGHEVGNHTFHHRNLTQLAPQQVLDEISGAQDTIATVTGQVPRYFRPPGGDYDVAVSHAVHQLGLMTVFWTANSADYTNTAPAALEARVLSELSHGGILLFHEGMMNTIRILPHLVSTLRSRGYEISTVGDVVAHRFVGYDGRSSPAKSINPRSTSVPTNSTLTRSPTSSP